MQSRFWLDSYSEYELAKKAKEKLENDNPDNHYQIRKGTSSEGNLIFRLVERFKNNEVKVIQENRKGRKKRGKKKNEDLSWIRG